MAGKTLVGWATDRVLSLIPTVWRRRILLRMFRTGAAWSVKMAFATDKDFQFKRDTEQFFDELRTIIGKMAMLPLSEKAADRRSGVLKLLLGLDNELYKTISARACEYDGGLHPKHRLIRYHDFFCSNVGPNESVLDIGCGNGFLTSDVAKCTCGRVVGIDMSKNNIAFAREHYRANNIEFMCGDVKTGIAHSHFDVVIMSNVLEHLPNRVEFLEEVREKVRPMKFLIRVPDYEREWMVPLKQELGVNYLLDPGHEIEYTQEGFFADIGRAGLRAELTEIKWGEIWCRAIPAGTEGPINHPKAEM